MKRFSLFCCLVLLLNVLCPVGMTHVHAEEITTPTDLPCEHTTTVYTIEDMMHVGVCVDCGEEGDRGQHWGLCTAPTVCCVCGASETEVTIVDVTHDVGEYEYNDAEHWNTCPDCSEVIYTGAHWSNCDSPNYCVECGASNVTIDVGHMLSFTYTDTTHQSQCVSCGVLGEVENHEAYCWDDQHCYMCEADNVTMSKIWHYTRDMQNDDAEHWEYCDGCDQEINEREAHYDDCMKPDGKCDVCGAACGEDALNHAWVESSVVEATCTAEGVKSYMCERCNGTRKEITAEATGHSWGDPVTVDATCTTDGSKTTTCTKCDEKTVETIKATGHTWGDPVTVDATCTVAGSKTTACTKCDEKTVETIPATGAHTWGEPVTVEATCAAAGSITTTCDSCGEKTVESIPSHNNHNWEIVVNVAATCTKQGRTEKTCTVCDETSITTRPAKGHDVVIDKAKEATNNEEGRTEGKHCGVCGTVIVKQQIIPAVKKESVPMTELEILVNNVTSNSQHDHRGNNIPQNGKNFEIPLTKSNDTSKGVALQVYRDDNETYNAVGLSVSFKEDVTEEITFMKDESVTISELKNEEKCGDFVEYVRGLIVAMNPEKEDDVATDELVLEILRNIMLVDADFSDLITAFVDGELDMEQSTVIRDGYEYFLISDGKTISLSVRKIEK